MQINIASSFTKQRCLHVLISSSRSLIWCVHPLNFESSLWNVFLYKSVNYECALYLDDYRELKYRHLPFSFTSLLSSLYFIVVVNASLKDMFCSSSVFHPSLCIRGVLDQLPMCCSQSLHKDCKTTYALGFVIISHICNNA